MTNKYKIPPNLTKTGVTAEWNPKDEYVDY